MNEFLTTEQLVLKLQLQQNKPIAEINNEKKVVSHNKRSKISKIIYWIIVGLMAIYMVFSIIPIVFKDRAVNILGLTTMLAVPNDQELDEELTSDVIHVKKFKFEDIKIGDRIVIYGKFSTELYWVEEVVSIDETNETLDTTFGYFIRNTYSKDEIRATFSHHVNTLSTILYVSTTPRGFASLFFIEALILSVVYYYFVRKPKEKK